MTLGRTESNIREVAKGELNLSPHRSREGAAKSEATARGREVGASRAHACAAATGSLARRLPPRGHVTQTPAARLSRRRSSLRRRRTTVEASPCVEGGRWALCIRSDSTRFRFHTRAGLASLFLLAISASRLAWDDAHSPLQAATVHLHLQDLQVAATPTSAN